MRQQANEPDLAAPSLLFFIPVISPAIIHDSKSDVLNTVLEQGHGDLLCARFLLTSIG